MSTRPLRLYNTLTRAKQDFAPIDPADVRMYVCGPTVYDFAHIGNARPVIVFDVLFRLLRFVYGEAHVRYVRNITDVDDKINLRAAERGITIRELTEETNRIFQADVAALGCLEPTRQPRATEHIAEMIAIVGRLIDSGHAYAADGHVLFSVPSMPDYGRLSRRPLDEMVAGARVDVAPYKKGDMDFVLWKPSTGNEPGWDSPWGRGRPGWHLECSAMSWKHLGEVFDIHGGGIDLVFPHHENEIAQTRCAFGHDAMANVWMHNGFLQVEGEKMSKSLGNFVTINELLHSEKFGGRKWPGEVLRLAMLKTHYRQPIDFSVRALEEAERQLHRWYQEADAAQNGADLQVDQGMIDALSDDLNTPAAIARLHTMSRSPVLKTDQSARVTFQRSAQFLGLLKLTKSEWLAPARARLEKALFSDSGAKLEVSAQAIAQGQLNVGLGSIQVTATATVDAISNQHIEERIGSLLAARIAARKAKNWAESDRIRDELAAMGVVLKDNKDGTTTWEAKR